MAPRCRLRHRPGFPGDTDEPPPGSGCAIIFGTGIASAAAGSAQGLTTRLPGRATSALAAYDSLTGLAEAAFTKEHTMRADIVPGGIFPDYELTDHTKTRRRLGELQGIDPMILVLSRGGFCPKDRQQHLELAANYPKIRVAYTQIVTISTDNTLKTNEFRDSVGAQWTFLSDAGHKIQKDLDIQEYTDSYYDPMIPYTLVLKPGLVTFSVYNGYWFWGRPSFEDLRRDLRGVIREIRPDWDLAAPGLRENWKAGDHSMHHPYQQADHMRTVTPLSVQKD